MEDCGKWQIADAFSGRYECLDLERAIKGATLRNGHRNTHLALMAIDRYLDLPLVTQHGEEAWQHINYHHARALCVIARERFPDFAFPEPVADRLRDRAYRAAISREIPAMTEARVLKALGATATATSPIPIVPQMSVEPTAAPQLDLVFACAASMIEHLPERIGALVDSAISPAPRP